MEEFTYVLESVRDWIVSTAADHGEKLKVTVTEDDEDCLVVNLENDRYVSCLAIDNYGHHPYRYLEYTVYDLRRGMNQRPVYSYTDRENSTVKEIVNHLDEGLAQMFEPPKRGWFR